jgi:hypothetical protein
VRLLGASVISRVVTRYRAFVCSSKAEMCVEVGAVAMIDDSVRYALDCAPVVERVFLFGDYAWNRVRAALSCHPCVRP